ncbi:hypothetical protein ACFTAO_03595 [Paenibacillus rhizoplanae]
MNTIGLALDDPSGASLLQNIASGTGGQYYDVADANRLGDVFQQIYDRLGDRTLLTERSDQTADSPYYAVVRVLALMLLGTALGLGLGIVFDNRHLARSFSIGGRGIGTYCGADSGIRPEWRYTLGPYDPAAGAARSGGHSHLVHVYRACRGRALVAPGKSCRSC